MFKKIIGISLWIIELFMLYMSFYVLTSTISFCPWFEPFPMRAMLLIVYGVPIQLLIVLAFLVRYRKLPFTNKIRMVPLISECMLLLIIFLWKIYAPLFYLTCMLFSFVDIILFMIWGKVIITNKGRHNLLK